MSKRITIRWKETCVTWAWATKRLSFLWKTSEEGVVLTFIGRERAWNRSAHLVPWPWLGLSRHCSVAARQKRVHPRALIIPRFSDHGITLPGNRALSSMQDFFVLPSFLFFVF